LSFFITIDGLFHLQRIRKVVLVSYPRGGIQGANCRLGEKTRKPAANPLVFLTLGAIGGPSSTKMRLGFVVINHSDDYISLFVSFFDIPVSLDNLFQGIASINNGSYLSFLDKLFEEDQIFSLQVASGTGIPANVKIDSCLL
jgi:hypothetical protein